MRIFKYLLLLIFIAACDNSSVNPEYPIEDKINANRPFNRIVVHDIGFTFEFLRNDPNSVESLSDAYAEDGYLVVITRIGSEKKTYYFSLLSAKKVETYIGKIFITY